MNNWLGLIVGDGRNLIIEINKTNNYVGIKEEKWCTISLELISSNINFKVGGELITDYEIKEIANNLKKVLENQINETIVFETLESYFNFNFNEDSVRININFYPSSDSYSLYLDKFNIKKLLEYLNNFNIN